MLWSAPNRLTNEGHNKLSTTSLFTVSLSRYLAPSVSFLYCAFPTTASTTARCPDARSNARFGFVVSGLSSLSLVDAIRTSAPLATSSRAILKSVFLAPKYLAYVESLRRAPVMNLRKSLANSRASTSHACSVVAFSTLFRAAATHMSGVPCRFAPSIQPLFALMFEPCLRRVWTSSSRSSMRWSFSKSPFGSTIARCSGVRPRSLA